MAKAPLKSAPNALLQLDTIEDDVHYHITLERQITHIDGRPIRPGPHLQQLTMRGEIVKRLATENPGAISGIERA